MIAENMVTFLRGLQGQRRGMGSELVVPDELGEALAAFSLSPSILIQTSVLVADVSYYQLEIDWQKMASQLAGAIIRAGQRTWPDVRFRENWTRAKAAGVPRGSYWFYDSREDPKKQAALWWAQLEGDVGELVHVADFEESYGGPYWQPQHFKEFILEFQRLSGLADDRIAIYTGYFWWLSRVGADVFFRRYALWLAWYAAMSVVRVPAPWGEADLLFWQWTSSGDGLLYGVKSLEIDLNWFCCDLVAFRNRFNLGGTVPPVEEPMEDHYFKLTPSVAGEYRSIRGQTAYPSIPHIFGTSSLSSRIQPGQYAKALPGDVYEYQEDVYVDGILRARVGDRWWKIFEANGVGYSGWVAEIHLGVRYLLVEEIGAPAGQLPVLTVSLRAEGYPPVDVEWRPL